MHEVKKKKKGVLQIHKFYEGLSMKISLADLWVAKKEIRPTNFVGDI